MLGATLSADLSTKLHLDEIVVALRTIRSHGRPPGQLEKVARAITMATLLKLGGGLPPRVIGVGLKDSLGDLGDLGTSLKTHQRQRK